MSKRIIFAMLKSAKKRTEAKHSMCREPVTEPATNSAEFVVP
jgi:hypothetical protein